MIENGKSNVKMSVNIFEEFVGKDVKVPYRDGKQFKIARGKLNSIEDGFLKISGVLGTIIINSKNIEKMSELNKTRCL